ncbi:MAG: hypothetical protein JWP07_3186 [Pseudonocardiales bacterium]|nr:hypothetical protein [Pseudonocardiales bacterium]
MHSSGPRLQRRYSLPALLAAGSTACLALVGIGAGSTPASAAPATTTVTYSGAPVPIPDGADLSGNNPGAPATASLVVSGLSGPIQKVVLRIDGSACSATAGSTTVGIDHTFVEDLDLTLTAPGGASVLVVNNTDDSGNNFCQTVLDDAAVSSIQAVVSAQAPFTGTFSPANPLSAFDGLAANGTWGLTAQDFFSQDTGSIRAFSLIITTAAPVATVAGTKTVAGSFHPGGTVAYTIVDSNSGNTMSADNPGHEMTDVLPSGLTLVSASATSGTAVTSIGTNTVTWDGALAPAAPVTITVTATVNAGTGGSTITNQATLNYDADLNGTNETSALSDDPGQPGANDPTSFAVTFVAVDATKTVAGDFAEGGTVTYTIVSSNSGNAAAADNPGNELADALPAELTLVSATATSGTAVATVGTNTVTWNGSIPATGSVTVTITATVNAGAAGSTISNQATLSYDADLNGTNEASALSDDPAQAGANDPTSFVATAAPDTTPPSVSIEQAAGQADPTATPTIHFTVVFSEPVTGFAADDVTIGGTAAATTATITGSGPTYTVAITGLTGSGTVVASVRAGAAQDAATNSSLASTSADNVVTYAPAPSSTTPAPSSTPPTATPTSSPSGAAPLANTGARVLQLSTAGLLTLLAGVALLLVFRRRSH